MTEGLPLPEFAPPKESAPKRRRSRWMLALVACGAIGLMVTVLCVAGDVRSFRRSGDAMWPGITNDDAFMSERITYWFREPRRGDVVVLRTDGLKGVTPGLYYVKRLVGLPGERIRISGGRLFVNGVETPIFAGSEEIRYATHPAAAFLARDGEECEVPVGHYFVLGDNPPKSKDSRFFGPVPRGNIAGRAFFRYSPLGRMGRIR